tara:strand:- start:644 stop:1006 length:363 start_codon:yes stop_codon:yes gene_type:complete
MNDTEQQDFQTRFDAWMAACQEIINEHYKKYQFVNAPTLAVESGRKFWRVVRINSTGGGDGVYAFVVLEDGQTKGLGKVKRGDILKPASYKTPARHARGNIFDDKQGMTSMGWHGPAYLR